MQNWARNSPFEEFEWISRGESRVSRKGESGSVSATNELTIIVLLGYDNILLGLKIQFKVREFAPLDIRQWETEIHNQTRGSKGSQGVGASESLITRPGYLGPIQFSSEIQLAKIN